MEVDAILAITFTEKAAAELKERVRERLVELGMRDDARDAEGSLDLDHPRLLRARAAHPRAGRRASTPSSGCWTSWRPSGWASTRSTARSRTSCARPAASTLELLASYTPDRLRDMVRTAYSLAAQPRAAHPRWSCRPSRPTGRPRRRELAAAALAAAADLEARRGGKTVARRDREAGALPRRRPLDGALPELGALNGFDFKPGQHEGAARPRRCAEYLRGARRLPQHRDGPRRAPHPGAAARAAGGLRQPPRGSSASAPASTSRTSSWSRATCCGQRGHPRLLPRALRPRAGRRVPGHQPAPERAARRCSSATTCSGSATSASRSTASATPTSTCSPAPRRRPTPRAAPRA